MGLLSTRALDLMRSAVAGMLPDLCTVRVRSVTIDSLGGEVVTWTSTTNVPCKLSPLVSKDHSSEGERFNVHAGWVLTLRHDQGLSSGDEITHSSQTYIVVAVEDNQSFRAGRRAYLRRLN